MARGYITRTILARNREKQEREAEEAVRIAAEVAAAEAAAKLAAQAKAKEEVHHDPDPSSPLHPPILRSSALLTTPASLSSSVLTLRSQVLIACALLMSPEEYTKALHTESPTTAQKRRDQLTPSIP